MCTNGYSAQNFGGGNNGDENCVFFIEMKCSDMSHLLHCAFRCSPFSIDHSAVLVALHGLPWA